MLLADLADAAPSAGIEMTVGYLHEANESPAAWPLRERGIEPQLLGVQRLADIRSLRRVRAHLRTVAPDLVHTHLSIADALGGLAARSLGIPAVCTIHVIGRPVNEAPGARSALRSETVALSRRIGDRRIIAVSEAARLAYLQRHREHPRRVVAIHNGITTPRPILDRSQTRAALGITSHAPVVALVAVLRAGKGHDVALRAVASLRDRHPDLTLLIVGDGPARAEIAKLAEPLGATVVFTGHRNDVAELLAAVDVLLHPTSTDAFPTVLLEACAAGLPVLATRVGGIPEIVLDGESGLLVDAPPSTEAVASGLARLLGDAQLRARMGAVARARFQREFSAERWASRLRELYDEVMTEGAAQ